MENKTQNFEDIRVPVYFSIEDNKVLIDVESMENDFDMKVKELEDDN